MYHSTYLLLHDRGNLLIRVGFTHIGARFSGSAHMYPGARSPKQRAESQCRKCRGVHKLSASEELHQEAQRSSFPCGLAVEEKKRRKDADPSRSRRCSFASPAQPPDPPVTFNVLKLIPAVCRFILSGSAKCFSSAMVGSSVHSALFLCAFLQLFSLLGGQVPNCQEVRTVFQSLHPGSKWVPETPVSGNCHQSLY